MTTKHPMELIRHFRRKVIRYIDAESHLLNKGAISVTKLNNMSDRRVIKAAKKTGWIDNFNCKR